MEILSIISFFILFYICTVSLGMLISQKLILSTKKYYFPIGLISIFGIYEILMFIPMYFKLSSMISTLVGIVLLTLVIYSFIVNKKNIVKELFDKKQFMVCGIFILTFLLIYFFGYIGDFRSDHNFYISLIQEGMRSDRLNIINLLQSGNSTIALTYSQDGFYFIIGLLANICHINGYLFSIWFTPFLYMTFATTTMLESIEHLTHSKNRKIIFTLATFLLVFSPLMIDYTMMGNLYRDFVIVIILLTLTQKEMTFKEALFLFIAFFAGISVHSTFVFLSLIMLLAKFIQLVLTKSSKDQVAYFLFYSFSILLNAALLFANQFLGNIAYIHVFILITIILLVSLLIYNLWKLKQSYQIFSMLIILLTVVIFGLSIYCTITNKAVFNYNDFFYEVLLPNATRDEIISNIHYSICYVITLATILFIHKKDNYISCLLLTTYILFFNPLTIAAISTYLTNVVYFRVAFIFSNFFILFSCINYIKKDIYFILGISSIVIVFCLPYQYALKALNPVNYNLTYRVEQEAYEAFDELENISNNYYLKYSTHPNTFTTDYRTPFFTKDTHYVYNLYSWRSGFYEKTTPLNNDEYTQLYRYLSYSRLYSFDPDNLQSIIKEKQIHLIFMNQYQSKEIYSTLDTVCKSEYYNADFVIYSCNQ